MLLCNFLTSLDSVVVKDILYVYYVCTAKHNVSHFSSDPPTQSLVWRPGMGARCHRQVQSSENQTAHPKCQFSTTATVPNHAPNFTRTSQLFSQKNIKSAVLYNLLEYTLCFPLTVWSFRMQHNFKSQ